MEVNITKFRDYETWIEGRILLDEIFIISANMIVGLLL